MLATALLLVVGITVPAAAAPDPLTCAGYAERRQFIDAQAWWLNEPDRGFTGGDRGHAHMGAYIPERERVSGTVPFDVRIVLHDNPGRLTYVSACSRPAPPRRRWPAGTPPSPATTVSEPARSGSTSTST
jgi:hypothetical protein